MERVTNDNDHEGVEGVTTQDGDATVIEVNATNMESDDFTSDGKNSPPLLPPDSPGSSVSTRLQEEYTELLRYTVSFDTPPVTQTLKGIEHMELTQPISFTKSLNINTNSVDCHQQSDEDQTTPRESEVHDEGTQSDKMTANPSFQSLSQHSITRSATAMSSKLDCWLEHLKSNVMSELTSSLMKSLESQRQEQIKEMEDVMAEKHRLQQEVNRLSELVNTMEQCLTRKDNLIESLSQSIGTQRNKTEMAHTFYRWRSDLLDKDREKFMEQIAEKHHRKKLNERVLKSWFGLIQTRWRHRLERKCQEQAQAVCMQLTNDYEAKINSLNGTIRHLETKVNNLQSEREHYTDQVKKAFMRGVCALNNEAMSAFSHGDQAKDGSEAPYFPSSSMVDPMSFSDTTPNKTNSLESFDKDLYHTKSLPSELIQSSGKYDAQPLQIADHNIAVKQSKARASKPKSASSRSAPKAGLQHSGQILAPPMASIVVEKHQPVTKQTVGKATALRFPKQTSKESHKISSSQAKGISMSSSYSTTLTGQGFKPLAGQTLHPDLIHSVKVVQ